MSRSFKKIAVVNRGEIAVRIIHTLQEMGITSILLHASEDQKTLAYRLADETICIGSGKAQNTYLNLENIKQGLVGSGAEALHPGVGFLSESAKLAQMCENLGIIFIGPSPENLNLFNNKITTLKHVESLGIPVLKRIENQFLKQVQKLGFPLLIKSACGGGGVGIKKVNQESELLENLKVVQGISQNTFGSKDVFLEEYLHEAQHIEVQIFGDHQGRIHHLFERNCSIQRRNQKIIEESPANIPQEIKEQMFQMACRIGESIQYKGAGTVEFLLKEDEFFFIEMNTRLQVEHPVTELLLKVDLVRAQILTAMEESIEFLKNTELKPKGHVLECRIYSQDPKTTLPLSNSLGSIRWYRLPQSRFDMGYESNDMIPSFYDSLIGKIITLGENRKQAIEKMNLILKNSFVFGTLTNIPELTQIISSDKFQKSHYNIQFLKNFKYKEMEISDKDHQMIQKQIQQQTHHHQPEFNPWFQL